MPRDTLSDAQIRALLESVRTIAVVGASPKPSRPSHGVMASLMRRGYHVIPVNPMAAGQTILGRHCHAGLAEVPEPIDMVDIFRAADAVGPIVDAALALTPLPKVIWMQIGAANPEAASRAEAAGIPVVMDRCATSEAARLLPGGR